MPPPFNMLTKISMRGGSDGGKAATRYKKPLRGDTKDHETEVGK